MPCRRIINLLALFTPLVLFLLLLLAPHYSSRWSLILQGHPFARIVPKTQLDVFQFVSTDNLRSQAIVFSDQTAIGWIYQPMAGFAEFVPFSGQPSFDDVSVLHIGFTDFLLVAWSLRWWLIVAEVLLLFSWFGLKKSGVQQPHPSEPTIAEAGH